MTVFNKSIVKVLPRLTFDNGNLDKILGLDDIYSIKDYFKKKYIIKNANVCIELTDAGLPNEIVNSLNEAKAALSAIVLDKKWEYGKHHKYKLLFGNLDLLICTPDSLSTNNVFIRHEATVGNHPILTIDFDLNSRTNKTSYWYSVRDGNFCPENIKVTSITEMKNLLELIYNDLILMDSYELYDF